MENINRRHQVSFLLYSSTLVYFPHPASTHFLLGLNPDQPGPGEGRGVRTKISKKSEILDRTSRPIIGGPTVHCPLSSNELLPLPTTSILLPTLPACLLRHAELPSRQTGPTRTSWGHTDTVSAEYPLELARRGPETMAKSYRRG